MSAIATEASDAVEKALKEAELRLTRMPPTPGARELAGRLNKYRHIIAGWSSRSPTDEPAAAMRDCVADVSRLANDAVPAARIRGGRSSRGPGHQRPRGPTRERHRAPA